jgi:hypothetical protein
MSEPPKFAELLLRCLVGGRDAEAVIGDLSETFAERGGGRLWYWGQVLSCLAVRFSLHRRALPGIGTDFSRALRRMRRNPGYALTAMFCLALALGVNTTLFSFLDSLYFRRLPVPGADRIVSISRERASFCTSRQYFAIRNSLHTINAAAVIGSGDPLELGRMGLSAWVESVSPNYPEVLGLGTVLGRWFGEDCDSVAIPRFWGSRYGSWINSIGW